MYRRTFIGGLALAGFGIQVSSKALAQAEAKPAFKIVLKLGQAAMTLRLYTSGGGRGVAILVRDGKGDHWLSVRPTAAAQKVLSRAADAGLFTVRGGGVAVKVGLRFSGEGGTFRFESENGRITGNFGTDAALPSTQRGLISAIGAAIAGALGAVGNKLVELGQGIHGLAEAIGAITSGNFTIIVDGSGDSTQVTVHRGNPANGFIAEPGCNSNPMMMC